LFCEKDYGIFSTPSVLVALEKEGVNVQCGGGQQIYLFLKKIVFCVFVHKKK
jgi:hypothetical protein